MHDFLLWLDLVAFIFFLLALLSIPSVLVQRTGRPLAALAWILTMVAFPPVGMILWWAFGRRHLKRQRRRRRASTGEIADKIQKDKPVIADCFEEEISLRNSSK